MIFSRIFSREYVRIGLKLANKDEALETIAKIASSSSNAESVTEQQILDALRARENLCSTGFSGGIAIPHCKIEGIKDFITGILTVPEGVDFDDTDHQSIKIIVFLIGPVGGVNDHIRMLALIAQKLNEPGIVDKLLAQDTPEDLIQHFENSHRSDLPTDCAHGGHETMNIVVQDEDWFSEILQVLSGYEDSQVVVLEAQYEGSYLVKLPFFSNVWSDHDHKFCKMIVATVEKQNSGEIIRKIDRIVDGLKDCERVMITIQPIVYMAGSLQL